MPQPARYPTRFPDERLQKQDTTRDKKIQTLVANWKILSGKEWIFSRAGITLICPLDITRREDAESVWIYMKRERERETEKENRRIQGGKRTETFFPLYIFFSFRSFFPPPNLGEDESGGNGERRRGGGKRGRRRRKRRRGRNVEAHSCSKNAYYTSWGIRRRSP